MEKTHTETTDRSNHNFAVEQVLSDEELATVCGGDAAAVVTAIVAIVTTAFTGLAGLASGSAGLGDLI